MQKPQFVVRLIASLALIALALPMTSGVNAQESDVVTPAMPEIVQTTCSADGQQIPPSLVLPQDTSSISYSIQAGTVGAGEQVDVLATLRGSGAWDHEPDNWIGDWSADSDTTALLIIHFDDPDCTPLGVVAPVSPAIADAVCVEDGVINPLVTLAPNSEAVSYTLQGEIKPGGTITVIATLGDGYVWANTAGTWPVDWTVNPANDRQATTVIDFIDPDCDATLTPTAPVPTTTPVPATPAPTAPITGLPTVGSGSDDAVSTTIVALLTVTVAGVFVVSAVWLRDVRSGR